MQCSRCQAESRPDLQFCENCGNRLTVRCMSCGSFLLVGKHFCGHCGAEAYNAPTPVLTADHIERKQLTVLFADITGSMALIADSDPEEARALLDPIVESMMAAVRAYQGTVTDVMGDGIMALFGAPLAQEDHALRACHAGLRMIELVRERQARDGVREPVEIRVGVNSGDVVVRSLQSYSAIGRETHLAARLEKLARPGTVLISDATWSMVNVHLTAAPLGRMPVRGLAEAIATYELAPDQSADAGLGPAAGSHTLSPLVGRVADLGRLHELLQRAGVGHGQLVSLVGDPGVGKSRLAHELMISSEAAGWRKYQGRTSSYSSDTAYLLIVSVLHDIFAIRQADSAELIAGKVATGLAERRHGLDDIAPALLWLLDVAHVDPQWRALDASLRHERTVDALERLLVVECERQPLLLLFEDLHWIDPESRSVLDALVEILPATRLLIVITYRPDFSHQWANRNCYSQLRIAPLEADDSRQLLDNLVGTEQSLREIKDFLVRRTEGNPFYLRESVRALVDNGKLVGESGRYQASSDAGEIRVPRSVHAVLSARIDRLALPEKRLLQAAAVVGLDISLPMLREVTGLSESVLRGRLRTLLAGEFVCQTAFYPETSYRFLHWLTYEVTYDSTLLSDRKKLHGMVVDAFEKLYGDRLLANGEFLARHAVRGERWEQAVVYLRQSALQAAGRSSHQQAVKYLDEALAALRRLTPTQATMAAGIELHFAARNSLWALWDYDRIFQHLEDARQLAEALNDRRSLGWIASFMTQHYRVAGDLDRSMQVARQALAIGEELDDLRLRIDTSFRAGLTCLSAGLYGQAVNYLIDNVNALDGGQETLSQPGHTSVLSRAWIAVCLAEQGNFVEATTRGREAVAIADQADHPYSRVSARFGLGGALLFQGDFPAARETMEFALGLCERHGITVLTKLLQSQLGYLMTLVGELGRAVPLLEEAAELNTSNPTMARQALYKIWLGEAYLMCGRVADADSLCRDAGALAARRREKGHEAWALRLAGQVELRRQMPDLVLAGEIFTAARAAADGLGMRPLSALACMDRARVYTHQGDRAAARAALQESVDLFNRMRMVFWSTKAARLMGEL